jgi:hypothetical protein
VGLERGPLSLVSTTEELLDKKVAAPGQKSENTDVGIRRANHATPPLSARVGTNFASHSVSIVRSQTKATELLFNLPRQLQAAVGLV